MALRSQIVAEFKLCSAEDPAIDVEADYSAWHEYKTNHDPSTLKTVEGAEPTWFVCKPLPAQALLVCDAKPHDVFSDWTAFMFSVIRVDGLDGEQWEPKPIKSGIPGVSMLSDKCMAELAGMIGAGKIYEIGKAIRDLARLGPREKKG